MERLQKFIAQCGIASRRAAEQLIAAGRIRVNGKIINRQGVTVDIKTDIVEFDNKIIKPNTKKIYIILNKPNGFITSVKDDRNRRTVMQLIEQISERIFPVGRLDYNTEGLLLMTNDGDLTQKLLHPKFNIEKTYVATIDGKLRSDALGKLRRGIKLEDGMTAPARVNIISYDKRTDRSKVCLIIHEGRNRQIRRMLSAVGCDILALKRIQFAGLTLAGLKRGKYRSVTEEELEELKMVIAGKNR